eukprot:TRINITY_DN12874_c0_g1_i2.p1 TRINITY_DN12874_c0_g1~~TRINITY_DN12874_c0_g1_i2.p1  ORF type:complete len:370 (+),score=55.04 TRINITY_DN12874_c0_g1_i2:409-1518(+)
MWRRGLPEVVRARVWAFAVGNDLRITPQLYEILANETCSASSRLPGQLPTLAGVPVMDSPEHSPSSSPCRCDGTQLHATEREPHSDASRDEVDAPGGQSPQEGLSDSASTASDDDRDSTEVQLEADYNGQATRPSGPTLQRENTAAIINLDLHRTFPDLTFFQEEGRDHENLYRVLRAYVHFRPDIGYVQGMSYLAAVLLLYMDPYAAFVCLANMLHKYHFVSFFTMNVKQMNVHFMVFDMVFKDQLPLLHSHFRELGLVPEFYCVDWFVTLFSKSLPLDIAVHAWDLFFMDRKYLYKLAVGILKYFSTQLQTAPFEEVFEFITHLSKRTIEPIAFFESVRSIAIPTRKLHAMAAFAEKHARSSFGGAS